MFLAIILVFDYFRLCTYFRRTPSFKQSHFESYKRQNRVSVIISPLIKNFSILFSHPVHFLRPKSSPCLLNSFQPVAMSETDEKWLNFPQFSSNPATISSKRNIKENNNLFRTAKYKIRQSVASEADSRPLFSLFFPFLRPPRGVEKPPALFFKSSLSFCSADRGERRGTGQKLN